MKIAGFEFSEGARFQKGAAINAELVGQQIELLRRECHGEIQPQDIVADARNANSPLHSFFEWDDSEAAEQYRLSQARGLIRAVVAVYIDDGMPAIRMKAYVHISEPGAPHYREASHAMSQSKTRGMILQQAMRELQHWRNKYRDLQEFAALIPIIGKIEKKAG